MDPANVNDLPEATASDIRKEFEKLLDLNTETTTFDVKNALRAKGFWVNQVAVAKELFQCTIDSPGKYGIEIENNHRIYSRISTSSPILGTGIPKGTFNTISGVPAKPPVPKSDPVGDWEVFGRGGYLGLFPTEVFKNTTRNKARYEYAKAYNMSYVDTSAKRV